MSYRLKLDASSARLSQLSTQASCVSASRADNNEACGAMAVDTRVDLDTKKLLTQTLLTHPVLSFLGSDSMHEFISALQYYEIGPGERIYEAGSPSRQLYFLVTGTVRLKWRTREELVVRSGSVFGDQALFSSLRAESASTLDPTTFWSLSADALQSFTAKIRTANFERARATLLASQLDFHLSPNELAALASELLPCRYQHGDKIVVQDDAGSLLFFVAQGMVQACVGQQLVRVMSEGEFFGEQALLYGGIRTATVEALEKVQCFAIEKGALVRLLGGFFDQIIYRNTLAIALDTNPVLATLPDSARAALATSMRIQSVVGTVIPAGAAKGDRLCIVLSGVLAAGDGSRWTHYGTIGDRELCSADHSDEVHGLDIVVESDKAVVAEIGRWEFHEAVGLSMTTFDSSKVRIFQDFSAEAKARLLSAVQLRTFSAGAKLVSELSPSPFIYVIKSGAVRLSRSGRLLKLLAKYDSVGERSLFLTPSLWATAEARSDVEAWAFDATAAASDISQMTRYELTHEAQSEDLPLSDLLCVEPLGSGQFGCVFFAVTPKPAMYAVKCISKKRIGSGNLQHDVLNEKKVLLQVNHQMVLRMHRTFRDEDNVYFLLEHVSGKLFFDVLLELGQCTEMMAKFYMGCLVLIFGHLAERSIVYRDLKPENLMVDSDGFLKLIDFGSAKTILGRTNTVIGTPQYMAPEIILGKAYTASVDMWSLGIVLYELVCNGVPFGDGQEDTYLVFQQVLSMPLRFPTFIDESAAVCSLIAALLVRDPKKRLLGRGRRECGQIGDAE